MQLRYTYCTLPLLLAARVFAASPIPTHVPAANPRAVGQAAPNVLSPELTETVVAQGSFVMENPSGIFKFYGYNDNGPMLPTLPGGRVEARKTEPDKNVYLILKNQQGADPLYAYGTHFLFQGHENSVNGTGDTNSYLTRINLDADGAHRVTLMATQDTSAGALPNFDGITWYPFSQRLLLTAEGSLGGGVWQATLGVPSQVVRLTGIMGQGGYEGIQADEQGRIIIVEDTGGSKGTVNSHARRPNSFVYRFLPYNTSDLTQGGVLQALQLKSLRDSTPIEFNDLASADAHIKSDDVKDMHTYGLTFDATWVTIHDTHVDPAGDFNANAAAKAHHATPFKRPENGQFRPGSDFGEFIFDETADTDANTEAGATWGGFGAIFRLVLLNGNNARLSLVYNSPDPVHAGFDNCAFWDADHIVFVEDAGDGLHGQRNAFDSAWLFSLQDNYGAGAQPIRILALGRDASATLDSLIGDDSNGFVGDFHNDGDNEITGWQLSDGDPTVLGLLGAKVPKPFQEGWRLFYTQQHGDNNTFEVLSQDSIKAGH